MTYFLPCSVILPAMRTGSPAAIPSGGLSMTRSCALRPEAISTSRPRSRAIVMFGCLAGGPTYADVLVDFLARRRIDIEAEKCTEQDEYPSAYLGVLLGVAALAELGFKNEAARIEADWRKDYPAHAMTAFEADLGSIAAALLRDCKVQDRSLVDIVGFKRQMQTTAAPRACGNRFARAGLPRVRHPVNNGAHFAGSCSNARSPPRVRGSRHWRAPPRGCR
jgi:hypothetical protein